MDEGDLTIDVRGERVNLMRDRAALWGRTLLVADLHWGKAQSLQASGLASPCTLDEELARLSRVVARSGADAVVILGDLIHDRRSMTDEVVDVVARWRSTLDADLVLTEGNHDSKVKALPGDWRIHAVPELRRGPFVFRHAPYRDATHYAWSGHLHPACLIRGARDRLRLPCFAVGTEVAILPAFGTLTGGALVHGDYRRFAVTDTRLVEV